MGERWAAAVAMAGEEPPADLPAVVAEELIALWSDLSQALGPAGVRRWSVECDGLVVRIVMLSRLTSATPWQHVPASLLAEGIYQGILRSAGIMFAPPGTGGIDHAGWPAQPGFPGCPAAPTAEPMIITEGDFGHRPRRGEGNGPLSTVYAEPDNPRTLTTVIDISAQRAESTLAAESL